MWPCPFCVRTRDFHWGRTTERFLDLRFFNVGRNVDFGNFPVGFGVWEGVQSIDASCGIQIDGFSARTEPPGSFFDDVDALDVFAGVLGFLTLPPRGLMTACECPKPARSACRNSSILGLQNPA